MGAKFDKIFETVVRRHETGGYLRGDVVELRSNYKSSNCYKHMSSNMQSALDKLATCGLNISITQIGDKLSGASAGNQFKEAGSIVVTIAADQGGGRFYDYFTVTTDMIDHAKSAGIPDQHVHKSVITIKPEPLYPDSNHITRRTDKGTGKATPTEYKLAGESTVKFFSDDVNNLGMIYENREEYPLPEDEAYPQSEDEANVPYKSESKKGGSETEISSQEREMIGNALRNANSDKPSRGRLTGSPYFETAGQALNAVSDALESVGFSLDPVSNDLDITNAHYMPGHTATRVLPFRRTHAHSGKGYEHGDISNCGISFSFTHIGRTNDGKNIEVVAYPSILGKSDY